MFDLFQGSGIEQMGMNMQDALSSFLPKRTKKRKLAVKDARKFLINEEAQKLIDMDEVIQEAIIVLNNPELFLLMKLIKLQAKVKQLQLMFLVKVSKEIFYQLLKVQLL